jgi:hypothetical protein
VFTTLTFCAGGPPCPWLFTGVLVAINPMSASKQKNAMSEFLKLYMASSFLLSSNAECRFEKSVAKIRHPIAVEQSSVAERWEESRGITSGGKLFDG